MSVCSDITQREREAENERDNATEVKTQIYKTGSICWIDTRTDEGLEASDHFSFHRLSLKRRALSRLQRERKKKIYCDFNALYCAALRGRTESKRGK